LERTTASQKILDLESRLQDARGEALAPLRKELQDQLAVENARLGLIGGQATKEQLNVLRQGGGTEAINQINRNAARNLARQTTQNETRMLGINLGKGLADLGFKDLTDALNAQKTAAEQNLERLKLSAEYIAAPQSEQLRMTRSLSDELAQTTATLQAIPAAQRLAQTRVSGTPDQIRKAETDLATVRAGTSSAMSLAGQKLDTETSSAVQVENLTKARDLYKESFDSQSKALDITKYDLEFKQASLAKDLERGKITQDQFNASKYLLDLEQAGLTRSNALLAEQEKYTGTILDIRTKIAEQGGAATPEQITAQQAALTATNAATDAINRQYNSTAKLLDLNKQLTQRQLAYEDVFKNSFDNMADAILQFAQTGKISFGDLINTMIADIARFELRQQSQSIWSALRPAVMSMIPGAGPTINPNSGEFMGSLEFAKGGVFDYAMPTQAFAKGGTFTNQIVDSPTLFKFAKGTGLMGEAGPEAIMPLKRDSQGNLGVRAPGNGGGSNVEVVVNNFGSEKAETRETVDSRGNRKIEVTIGDMAAGEISRSGSASQKAVGGTFGLKPQLIRR
jgi:lambda family phage tail tape measure protein